jgi:hypothetical protein
MPRLTRATAYVGALMLAAAPAGAAAQIAALENLQIHGYLTQAYAQSDDIQINGIPTDATGDYRVAALQFRYAITENDNVTVQLRHRRLGTSPYGSGEGDVTLNWGFYQHTFQHGAGRTAVKVGKMPLPRGLYNEIRTVGTVLPFFRAPFNFYLEGYESYDGASATTNLQVGKGWSVEGTAFVGGYDAKRPATDPVTKAITVTAGRNENVRGGRLWVNTPIEGLRLGMSGMRFRARKATDTSTAPTQSQLLGSVDGNFNRFMLRGEFAKSTSPTRYVLLYYGQAGVKLTEKLGVYGQIDVSDHHDRVKGGGYHVYTNSRDVAGSVNYAFSPNLVLKAERHHIKGFGFDRPVPTTGAPAKTGYTILSVSTSF